MKADEEQPAAGERPWDVIFARWIESGRKQGVDPNDIGDREWNDPKPHVKSRYLPHIRPDSVVLELGPGTGRITRHLIGRCREMILVDYSQLACEWLNEYLDGKGSFQTYRIDDPAMPEGADQSVDFLFAFGVFEHIGLDNMRCYLDEFFRVLRPGARAVFNFDNIMTLEGLAWNDRQRGERRLGKFYFYHPETVAWLGRAAGFTLADLRTDQSRHAEIELIRPSI